MQHYDSVALSAPKGHVLPAAIPLQHHAINRITQVRHSMNKEETDSLARKILATGQLARGRIVALTPEEAAVYLSEVNEIWGSDHQLRSMRKCEIDGKPYYLFVVFGHRRLAACERAQEMKVNEGARSAHFHDEYLCDIYFGIRAIEAITMQLGENTYVKPSLREEMDALWLLWRFMKRQRPSLRVGDFARKVGKRPERIKEMLQFTALPDSIQQRIMPNHPRGSLPYQLVLQHARLAGELTRHGRELSAEELEHSLDVLVLRRVKVDEYRKEVDERIAALRGKQTDLFALFDELVPTTTATKRRVVGEKVIRSILAELTYLEMVHRYSVEGRIGVGHPLGEAGQSAEQHSPHSPARLTLRLIDLLEQVAPELARELRAEGKPSRPLEASGERLPELQRVFEEVVAFAGK